MLMNAIKRVLERKWKQIEYLRYRGGQSQFPLLFSDFRDFLNNTKELKTLVSKLSKRKIIPNDFFGRDFYQLNILHEQELKKGDPIEDVYRNDFQLLGIIYTAVLNEIDIETNSKLTENSNNYSYSTEEINLKTYGIQIKGNFISRKGIKDKKIFDPTEHKLIYFLYFKYKNNKDECFDIKTLEKELGNPKGTLKNSITNIHRKIRGILSEDKKIQIQLIKNEHNRGYHLNPKILI
jgi:hypothetical protein